MMSNSCRHGVRRLGLLTGAVLVVLGTAHTNAAYACASATDSAALDVSALKIVLMEAAIDCSQRDAYNAFMTRMHGPIAQEEQIARRYIHKADHGRSYDGYTTDLANGLSSSVIGRADEFCPNNRQIFENLAGLATGEDLVTYASAQHFQQPLNVSLCSAAKSYHTTFRGKRASKHR